MNILYISYIRSSPILYYIVPYSENYCYIDYSQLTIFPKLNTKFLKMAKKKALTKKGQMRGCFDALSIPSLYTKCKSFL